MEGTDRLEAAYELGAELGRGGLGVVLAATRRRDGMPVAVKLPLAALGAEDEARILREARLFAALVHPRLVRFLGTARSASGALALVYERIDGRPLAGLIPAGGAEAGTGTAWLRDLAEGLDALHGAGLVHRDLKPGNALVERDGRLKLIDFGLARTEAPGATVTATGTLVGTPAYMAPERFSGGAPGRAADVYAFGCMAFEIFTGRPPYEGRLEDLVRAHARAPIPRLEERRPDLPRGFSRAVAAALAKAPGERPDRAGVLVEALVAAGEAAAVPAAGTVRVAGRVGEPTQVPGARPVPGKGTGPSAPGPATVRDPARPTGSGASPRTPPRAFPPGAAVLVLVLAAGLAALRSSRPGGLPPPGTAPPPASGPAGIDAGTGWGTRPTFRRLELASDAQAPRLPLRIDGVPIVVRDGTGWRIGFLGADRRAGDSTALDRETPDLYWLPLRPGGALSVQRIRHAATLLDEDFLVLPDPAGGLFIRGRAVEGNHDGIGSVQARIPAGPDFTLEGGVDDDMAPDYDLVERIGPDSWAGMATSRIHSKRVEVVVSEPRRGILRIPFEAIKAARFLDFPPLPDGDGYVVGFGCDKPDKLDPDDAPYAIAKVEPGRGIVWILRLPEKPFTPPVLLDGDLVLAVRDRLLRWPKALLARGQAGLQDAVLLRGLPKRLPFLQKNSDWSFTARLVAQGDWLHLISAPPPDSLQELGSPFTPVLWFRFPRSDLAAREEVETFPVRMPQISRMRMGEFKVHPVRILPDGRTAVFGITTADVESEAVVLDLEEQGILKTRHWSLDEAGRADAFLAPPEAFPTREPPGVVVYGADTEGRLFEWYLPLAGP